MTEEEIVDLIENFQNPYPRDIFVWDDLGKLDFNRGSFHEFIYNVVENTKRNIIKEIKA